MSVRDGDECGSTTGVLQVPAIGDVFAPTDGDDHLIGSEVCPDDGVALHETVAERRHASTLEAACDVRVDVYQWADEGPTYPDAHGDCVSSRGLQRCSNRTCDCGLRRGHRIPRGR